MMQWLTKLFRPAECQHKWTLVKQMVDESGRVFHGRRCKLCGIIKEEER